MSRIANAGDVSPEAMIEPPSGRLTLGDAMLLVAFMAPAFLMLRLAIGLGLFTRDPASKAPWSRHFLEYLSVASGCILFPLALLVLAVGLRETGFVTCLAVALASILSVAYLAVHLARYPDRVTLTVEFNNVFARLHYWAGPMIAGVWLSSACAGRWHAGRTWADRLGYLVGLSFVLISIYMQSYFLLH